MGLKSEDYESDLLRFDFEVIRVNPVRELLQIK